MVKQSRHESEEQWLRTERAVAADVDDGIVLLSIEDGRYFSLNQTASAIWRLIEAPRSVSAIVREIACEFDTNPACTPKIRQALETLREWKLADAMPASSS